jgi:hypothetical protein
MLRRIEEMDAAGRLGDRRGKLVSGFPIRFAAAASVILCLGIGLLIPATSPKPDQAAAATPTATTQAAADTAAIRDTYTDPQLALAAVKNALLVASVRMNQGENITQKNIDRLHDTWQVATGQKKQL